MWKRLFLANVCAAMSFAANVKIAGVSASGDDGNAPRNAIDGDPRTHWSCILPSGGECWLQADLGAKRDVGGAAIAWYQESAGPFLIQASADGITFTPIFAGVVTTAGAQRYDFPQQKARYLRIGMKSGRAGINELTVAEPIPPAGSDAGKRDVFNVTKIYPSASSGIQWNSLTWHTGQPRDITGYDPADPAHVGQKRGDSTVHVDGNGVMSFLGLGTLPEPRWYLNRPETHFFKNTEITVYYHRVGTDGAAYSGLVLGARSGPDGHSSNGDPCEAHTYYSRFRHDGRRDFEKELKHPASSPRNTANMWDGAASLPADRWIGMKFIIYNVNNNTNVKLEVYRDLTEGADGGTWEKLDELIDSGDWEPRQSSPVCSYPRNFIPTEGGGVILLRNTGTKEARYKWMSAREIVPPLR